MINHITFMLKQFIPVHQILVYGNLKKMYRFKSLGVIPRGFILRQCIRAWQAKLNDTLRSKIGLVVEELLKFDILLVSMPWCAPTGFS